MGRNDTRLNDPDAARQPDLRRRELLDAALNGLLPLDQYVERLFDRVEQAR